jgi:hypothetical protein
MAHSLRQNGASARDAYLAAEKYAACGWVPHALRGKVPITKGWNLQTVDTWEEKWPRSAAPRNVGIRTGPECNLIVVDIDKGDGGLETWEMLVQQHQDPVTVVVRTGGGGLHYYFAWDQRASLLVTGSRSIRLPGCNPAGIDVRAADGQVVAPPSIHEDTGETYHFVRRLEELEGGLPVLPEWLFELLYRGQNAAGRHSRSRGGRRHRG